MSVAPRRAEPHASYRHSRAGGNLAPFEARKRRIPLSPIRGEDAANAAGEVLRTGRGALPTEAEARA